MGGSQDRGSGEEGQSPCPRGRAYMVCILVLVRSKAQSTVAGSRPDTRLHSMETFNLRRGKGGVWSRLQARHHRLP